jgi:hypothetical protein
MERTTEDLTMVVLLRVNVRQVWGTLGMLTSEVPTTLQSIHNQLQKNLDYNWGTKAVEVTDVSDDVAYMVERLKDGGESL